MLSRSTLLALLSLASYVSANGISLSIGVKSNWGCSSSVSAKASTSVKNTCSSSGSFLSEYQGDAICCSSETRTSVSSGTTCPFNWGEHKTAKCCIPPTEVSPCDCGEGYSFDSNSKKCKANTGGCSNNQWFHERSSSCCDDSWSTSPPKGSCPSGITCPTGWFWHKDQHMCKPTGKRSPEPDCDNWDHNKQCCGSSTSPSQGSTKSKGGKRDLKARQQFAIFPQTDLDAMYCPNNLHACTIATASGGEWAYECVDFATELESCGGCSASGEGADCTQIPNAMSVGCEMGVCAVYTCKSDYIANGTTCALA